MEFTRILRKNGTIVIPPELIKCYDIQVGDLVTLDIVKNNRDGKVK